MKQLFYIIFLIISLQACGQTPKPISEEEPKAKEPTLIETLSPKTIDSLFNEANRLFKLEEVHEMIDETFRELNGSALVAINDSIIIRRSEGWVRLFENRKGYEKWSKEELAIARKKPENKLQHETVYELASLSKQFTAAAILKLLSEEKISLTDSLKTFFSGIPYPHVTIHQLLSHTSGLPEYFDFPQSYYDTSHHITNRELIDLLIEKHPKVQFSPGWNYKYTNTNYALLAAIVEQITEMTFEDYLYRHIFTPAGMKKSFFVTELDSNSSRSIAKGHLKNKEELRKYHLNKTVGDKGIYSYPEELFKWKIAFFDEEKIIPKKYLEMATTQQNKHRGKTPPSEMYGYGLRLEKSKFYGNLIYHGGLWQGYQNLMIYRPADNIFIVFLSNFRNGAHKGKGTEVLHILDGA